MDNILETLKDKIEEIVAKVKGDSTMIARFKESPIDTIKELLGDIELPDGALDNIVDTIKEKLSGNDADGEGSVADKIGDLLGKAKDLFGGKDE